MPVNLDSVYPPPLKLEPFRRKGSAGKPQVWGQGFQILMSNFCG